MLSPETVAAVCSRSSRTTGDLREVLVKEYLQPYISQKINIWKINAKFCKFFA